MDARHDDDHGDEAGDRQRIDRGPGSAEATTAGSLGRVEEVGHPVGVDGRHDPIDEDEDVEDLDEPEVLEGDPGQVEDVRPQPDPGPEGEQEDRRGGEADGALIGAGVGVTETGEDQGKERRREGRAVPRLRLLRVRHRRVG